VVELATVILIAGVLLGVATLSFSEISKGMKLTGAKRQLEEALVRAKTAARQENVTYRVIVHPASAPHPNVYEFLMNTETAGDWQLVPVDKSAGEEGVYRADGHVYVPLSGGVVVQQGAEIEFRPRGTTMSATPAEVVLRAGNRTARISVDASGKVSVR
jgi:Tfp pilus assembly protein FimT